jgi:RNase P subunit RPR2
MKYQKWHITLLPFLFTFAAVGRADSIYLDQMKQAQWSDQELRDTIDTLSEHKPIELAKPLKLAPFHHRAKAQPESVRDFCIDCHTILPHRKSERLRSYLNMHASHLACTSCHYQPQGVILTYRWQQHNGQQDEDPEQVVEAKLITPFYQEESVALTAKQPAIEKILDAWDTADIKLKAQHHLRLHSPLQPEGLDCKECHTTEASLLDFQQLGYDAEAIKKLTENRIARFLADESFKDKPIKLMDLLQ